MTSAYDLGLNKDSDVGWFAANFIWNSFAISLRFAEIHALS
jgi:hypothetical protein